MDFTSYDDAQLDLLRIAVLTEQEHRQALATTPAQVQEMSRRYKAYGGKVSNLLTAVGNGDKAQISS